MTTLVTRRIATLIVLVFSSLLIVSCDTVGDLEENPKSFAAPSNFYSTEAQVEGVFASTMDNAHGGWNMYRWSLLSAFEHTDQMGGNLNITANHGSDFWNNHFSNVADLNFAIASIKEGRLEDTPEDRQNELLAEARFLRGWNYFQMVKMFGALPLPTDEDTDDYFSKQRSRSSVSDVYDLIVSDFKSSISNLPDTRSTVARPTSDVARAMLSKTYLTMATHPLNENQHYEDAAQYAREVIEGGNYSLVEDVNDVFSVETENGPEMMWSFVTNQQDKNIGPKVWSAINGWGDQAPDGEWAEEYPEQPRKHAYIELENDEGQTWQELGESPGVKKYIYPGATDFDSNISTANQPIMRYAEVLLIFAEAENMANGGPTQEAVDAVNKVIERANGYQSNSEYPKLSTNMSQDEFDSAVIRERGLELCFEHKRWFDLVRKRILDDVVRQEVLPNFSETDYLWPIPESEMRTNENMEQNPGY